MGRDYIRAKVILGQSYNSAYHDLLEKNNKCFYTITEQLLFIPNLIAKKI
jgi:hypothetical protein